MDKIHPQYQRIFSKNNEGIPKTKNKAEDREKLQQEELNRRKERKTLTSGNQKVALSQYPTVTYLSHSIQLERTSRNFWLGLVHYRSQPPYLQDNLQPEISFHRQLLTATTPTYKMDKWSNCHQMSRNRQREYWRWWRWSTQPRDPGRIICPQITD